MTVHGNVFLRASRGFGSIQMNSGRDNIIDNNLFLDCQVAVSGGYGAGNKHWESAESNPPAPDFFFNDLYRSRYPELNRLFQPPIHNYMRPTPSSTAAKKSTAIQIPSTASPTSCSPKIPDSSRARISTARLRLAS